jgi:hypothetical protein
MPELVLDQAPVRPRGDHVLIEEGIVERTMRCTVGPACTTSDKRTPRCEDAQHRQRTPDRQRARTRAALPGRSG